jgi:hypothetical protein
MVSKIHRVVNLERALLVSTQPANTLPAVEQVRQMSVQETWMVNLEREAYRSEYRLLMKQHNVDFILCPAYVGVAAEPYEARYSAYTAIWNILDMPDVVFPTGPKVDQQLDPVEAGYQPRCLEDEAEYKAYSPDKFVDAAIALPLVRLPAALDYHILAYLASLCYR